MAYEIESKKNICNRKKHQNKRIENAENARKVNLKDDTLLVIFL